MKKFNLFNTSISCFLTCTLLLISTSQVNARTRCINELRNFSTKIKEIPQVEHAFKRLKDLYEKKASNYSWYPQTSTAYSNVTRLLSENKKWNGAIFNAGMDFKRCIDHEDHLESP